MTTSTKSRVGPRAAARGTRVSAPRKAPRANEYKRGQRLSSPELYINREISQVAFMRRVLEEAQSERHPLLERVKFLSFVSSQLDEFLMVRMAGLHDQVAAQVQETGPDGLLPSQQVQALQPLIHDLLRDQQDCFLRTLLPRLAAAGVVISDTAQLTPRQLAAAAHFFKTEILPVLTPLGVDPAHPFPHISNRSLNLAVMVYDGEAGDLFARIKIPATLRSLVPLPPSGAEQGDDTPAIAAPSYHFVWLEQLIAEHLDLLFPGLTVMGAYPFRVLRDADLEIQIDEAGDLLETVEQGLQKQRFGSVVAVLIQPEMPERVRSILCENLEIAPADLIELDAPLGLGGLAELLDLDRPDLRDAPLLARVPLELRRGHDPFAAIQRSDLLLHHPYDAFSSVAEFIETAARDPQVLAIKQTLYRVGQNSPIVQALLEANERGKQVAVLVELKARFDEENNIEWARTLERAGVHVVYGQVDLKTHAKVALVVRRESSGLQCYVHLGTGNYNAATARVYEDLALLTCRTEIAEDVINLFNALTGYARGLSYQKLLVAPGALRRNLLERIEREIAQQQAGGQGRIIFKTNALVDAEIIQALYRASQAGVQIDLVVRGMCCLRPGIQGVSENIRVVSLVGRILEHSRIYYFANGGIAEDEVFVGSADLMPRNLDHRVEVLFPILDAALRAHLSQVVLPAYLVDTVNARRMLSDGSYEHLTSADSAQARNVHVWFAHEGHQDYGREPLLTLHAPGAWAPSA